ncbi:MAG: signal recognition particle-docking protein FtsY [Acidimicrobiales bacterium]|nr:signal recognition particle-docking protein FtsY [Acidimicrobiales bacterium]RZV41007.1 MAG: signal recognition particle-docking protein FtsY [Acidimicrobiales bacterium]
MNTLQLIVLIVVVALVLLGTGLLFLRRRGDFTPPTDATTTDRADALGTKTGVDQIDLADVDADGVLIDRPVDEDLVDELVEEEIPASFRDRLGKARTAMSGYLSSVLSRGEVNAETWEDLEEALIRADVGVNATMEILGVVRERAEADGTKDPAEIITGVKDELKSRLGGQDISLAEGGDPSVWLFVGVNGVGKTTTIGKIATREVADGKSLVLAAGDTFRAAAAEQLTMWADRAGAAVIRGAEGGDPSSVIYDAVEHAASAGADIVLADTAGRLHTKTNLMNELSKVRRVAEKGAGTVTETLLVIDATTGQNGLVQAREFTEAADLTGVVLTKLDGSAKGGIVVAVQNELGIPVKLVGLGEGAHDLIPFDADEFVDALFETV